MESVLSCWGHGNCGGSLGLEKICSRWSREQICDFDFKTQPLIRTWFCAETKQPWNEWLCSKEVSTLRCPGAS